MGQNCTERRTVHNQQKKIVLSLKDEKDMRAAGILSLSQNHGHVYIAGKWYLVKSWRRARSQVTSTVLAGCFALDVVPWNVVKQLSVLSANLLVAGREGAHMQVLVLNYIKTSLPTNPKSMF